MLGNHLGRSECDVTISPITLAKEATRFAPTKKGSRRSITMIPKPLAVLLLLVTLAQLPSSPVAAVLLEPPK